MKTLQKGCLEKFLVEGQNSETEIMFLNQMSSLAKESNYITDLTIAMIHIIECNFQFLQHIIQQYDELLLTE